jgi:hypothetical protein
MAFTDSKPHLGQNYGNLREAPKEDTTFAFQMIAYPDRKHVNQCMWSAGRIGNRAQHRTQAVEMHGKTYQIHIHVLPSTTLIQNPQRPSEQCMWPVFFRGRLEKAVRTKQVIENHMDHSVMGNVSRQDKISWFATDPATALMYGYPDVYGIQQGLSLQLLDAGHPETEYHTDLQDMSTGPLSAAAATTAFVLSADKTQVKRGSEWVADNHVATLLSHSSDLIQSLHIDGWALDWSHVLHTEIMLINAFPKLRFLGSLYGAWNELDVRDIKMKYIDYEQVLKRQRIKEEERLQRRARNGTGRRLFAAMDDDDDNADNNAPFPGALSFTDD